MVGKRWRKGPTPLTSVRLIPHRFPQPQLEARGQADQAESNVKQTGEKAKDTVKDVFVN